MTTKALVVLSGGQDSTLCLWMAKAAGFDEIHAISFDYNQRHAIEILAAEKVADLAGVASHEVVTLGPILKGRSPLTNKDESLEQYSDFKSMDETIGDRVELTFVPMRNQLFLTIAMNRAVVIGAAQVFTGVCQADGSNYPDCRADFIESLHDTTSKSLGQEAPVISTPLMHFSKAASIHKALTLEGCYAALGYSHTAYDGSYPPTGSDHATILRAHGFEEAGVPDPLVVRAYWEGRMALPETDNYKNWVSVIGQQENWATPSIIHQGLLQLEATIRSGARD